MADEWQYRRTDTPHVFDIDGLHLWYGEVKALDGISCQLERNHITAVIGPSGCGKTSFLRVLNRMNELIPGCRREGSILYDRMDIDKIGDVNRLRRAVGMIFQIPNPFPMSIYENLAFPLKAAEDMSRSDLDEQVEKALRAADVWDEVKDRLTEDARRLSAGQQQRLCVARALAVKPDVLLMDEPTSALDPSATMRMEDLMQRLREHYSLILVTHNMQQAARTADETMYLDDGRLVEYGKTETIFSMPKKRQTEEYITGRFG